MSDTIKATISAAEWTADPDKAFKAFTDMLVAIPDHTGWVTIAAWSLVAVPVILGVLKGIKEVLPLIPGVGSMAQTIVDLAWKWGSHRFARQADQAAHAVASGAGELAPLLQAVKGDSRFAPLITPRVEAIAAALTKSPA